MKSLKLQGKFFKQTRNRHLVVWFLILLKFIFFTSITGSIESKIAWYSTLMLNFSLTYYALLIFVWPAIFTKRKYIYFLSLIALALFFFSVYYIQVEILIPSLGGNLIWTGRPVDFQLRKILVNFSYVIFASLGSFFNWRGIIQVENNLEMDKMIKEAEFRLLKSQFHSHLTFNFLNFFYNRIRQFSYETATSVEEFSNMLRYSLKGTGEERVSLSKEIEYIESCISFQKCLTDELYVNFNHKGEIVDVYILPRILAVFIENSFKHGVLNDSQTPITIFISSMDGEIIFQIKNRKNNQIYVESGIGIQNIRQILQLFYPQRHELNITDADGIFSCELILR